MARDRLKTFDGGQVEVAVPRRPDDRLAEWVLGAQLDGGSETQDLVLASAFKGDDVR